MELIKKTTTSQRHWKMAGGAYWGFQNKRKLKWVAFVKKEVDVDDLISSYSDEKINNIYLEIELWDLDKIVKIIFIDFLYG